MDFNDADTRHVDTNCHFCRAAESRHDKTASRPLSVRRKGVVKSPAGRDGVDGLQKKNGDELVRGTNRCYALPVRHRGDSLQAILLAIIIRFLELPA